MIVFLVAAIAWIYSLYVKKIKSVAIKYFSAPFLIGIFLVGGYFSLNVVVGENSKYALNNLARTAAITSYDIRYGWGARTGEGSGFTIGTLDGSWSSMFRLAPTAINVSLFRPYLWEVRNPLMLLAALESLTMLGLTIYFLSKGLNFLKEVFVDANFRFCIIFALAFAFAVGISTSNFGTLMRYKIPLIPFYMTALVILSHNYGKRNIS